MKKYLLTLSVLLACGSAFAQSPPPGIQQGPQRLDAGTTCVNGTNYNTVNNTSTATFPAGNGYAYITYVYIGVVQNGTGSAATNLNFTSTNLDGIEWGYSATATAGAVTVVAPGNVGAAPLKASSAGMAVTVVSPAAQTNTGYDITVCGYYSP